MNTLVRRLKTIPLAAAANAGIKAWMIERDAVSTQRHYAADTKRRGLDVPWGPGLRSALKARIADRAGRLGWPKPLGGLHIFLVYPYHNWEAVLPTALAEFGRVSGYEWRSRGFDETAADWVSRRESMNEQLLREFRAANRERPVDVVVGYVSGYTVGPEVLRAMSAQGSIITNFCFDDKVCWPGPLHGDRYASPAAIADAVDLNLTSDPEGAERYFAHGGLSMFHAEAADPTWYRPMSQPFEFDVSFVGAAYGWRPKLIAGLRRQGLEVACFGKGWPNGPIANDAMNGLYSRSRVNLGCGGIGFSHKLLCLKGRDFEVPMSGAVYLTQDNPELSEVFEVGREILVYRDIEDCARVIRATLNDPVGADGIRRAARARCVRDHTYTARWTTVFRALGALPEES